MRKILLYSALVLLGLAWLVAVIREERELPTSFSAKPSGIKAAYLWLDRLGYPIQRYFYPFTKLAGKNQLLFLVAPVEMGHERELFAWLNRGNHLIFFDSPMTPREKLLGLAGAAEIKNLPLPSIQHLVEARCELTTEGNAVSSVPIPRSSLPADGEVLLGTADQPHAYRVKVGTGSMTYISSARMILNEFIDKCDNAAFLTALIPAGTSILIDEFHHGYRAPLSSERRERIAALYWIGGILTFILILGAASGSVRLGPPLPVSEHYTASGADAVKALSRMYLATRSESALEQYLSSCRSRVAKRSGRARISSNEELISILDQSGIFREIAVERFRLALEGIQSANDDDIKVIEDAITRYGHQA